MKKLMFVGHVISKESYDDDIWDNVLMVIEQTIRQQFNSEITVTIREVGNRNNRPKE